MKYSENQGLGKKERVFLSKLLRDTKNTIVAKQAAEIWQVNETQAAKRLALFNKKGWLERIHQGVYIPVPLESLTSDIIPEEPFSIAAELFEPCYIGGVNAVNYWSLTEQLFKTVTVMTQRLVQDRKPVIAGTEFLLHTLKSRYFYGLKTVWLSNVKVKISDPSRTLVDMLMFPKYCGGINFIAEVLNNYCNSDMKSIDTLISYLEQSKNGAALKRLGFLLELNIPEEKQLINYCSNNLTTGYAKLNPEQSCEKLITRWRLWVPESWKEKIK